MPESLEFPELDLRRARGGWERATNAQQLKLERTYKTWARKVWAALTPLLNRGATEMEMQAVINRYLPDLEANINATFRRGILDAQKLVLKRRPPPAGLANLAHTRIAESEIMVKESLIPSMRNLMVEAIATHNPREIAQQLNAMRSRPAAYAGGYWAMIFVTGKEIGHDEIRARIQEGLPPHRVRWVLDPDAEHCVARPGYYGCPDLAGEYSSWDALPTVPAGHVACLGNCRCFIEIESDNGQWRRDL